MNYLSKQFRILIYPDSINVDNLITVLRARGFSFCGICHDNPSDLQKNDDKINKVHYHFVVWSKNPRSYDSFLALTGVSSNLIFTCDDFDNAIKYLTHESPKAIESGKYRYPRDSLIYNCDSDFIDDCYLNRHTEDKTCQVINDMILFSIGEMSFTDFLSSHPSFIYRLKSLETFKTLYLSELSYNQCNKNLDKHIDFVKTETEFTKSKQKLLELEHFYSLPLDQTFTVLDDGTQIIKKDL